MHGLKFLDFVLLHLDFIFLFEKFFSELIFLFKDLCDLVAEVILLVVKLLKLSGHLFLSFLLFGEGPLGSLNGRFEFG
jgi:hypothetical protein